MRLKVVEKNQPDYTSLHVNRPLTDMSVAFIQDQSDFVADKVFQVVGSPTRSNSYFTFPRGYFLRDQVRERSPGTANEMAGYTVSTDSFTCKVYGLAHPIPDENRANQDSPLDADRNGAQLLTSLDYIKREKLWNAAFFTTGVWTRDVTGNSVASVPGTSVRYWDDPDSTPIEDVAALRRIMKELTGKKFNVLTIGPRVWDALAQHPDIKSLIMYGNNGAPAIVTKQAVTAILGVEELLISEAIENTAAEGAADVFAFILGRHALLSYRPPSPGRETAAAGYTFVWTGLFGMTSRGFRISKYRDTPRKSDIIDMDASFVHKIVSADLGIFINGVVSSTF